MTYGTLCTLIISLSSSISLLQVLYKQNINLDISKHKGFHAYVYDQTYINQPNIPLPPPNFLPKKFGFVRTLEGVSSHIQTLISIFGYVMKRSLQHVYYSYQSYNTIILLPVTQLGISQYSHLLFLSFVKHHGR